MFLHEYSRCCFSFYFLLDAKTSCNLSVILTFTETKIILKIKFFHFAKDIKLDINYERTWWPMLQFFINAIKNASMKNCVVQLRFYV